MDQIQYQIIFKNGKIKNINSYRDYKIKEYITENFKDILSFKKDTKKASNDNDINNFSQYRQLDILDKNPSVFKEIKDPSFLVQVHAINLDGDNIQYVKEPSEELKKSAIEQKSSSIQYMNNPSEELQILSIIRDPRNIQYIKHPSEKVQLKAVELNPIVLKIIKNPSKKVQLKAEFMAHDMFDGRNIKDIKLNLDDNDNIKVTKEKDGIDGLKDIFNENIEYDDHVYFKASSKGAILYNYDKKYELDIPMLETLAKYQDNESFKKDMIFLADSKFDSIKDMWSILVNYDLNEILHKISDQNDD